MKLTIEKLELILEILKLKEEIKELAKLQHEQKKLLRTNHSMLPKMNVWYMEKEGRELASDLMYLCNERREKIDSRLKHYNKCREEIKKR